jgi:hypothetical protein
MPIGRSRCGFLASCAAVETASKPMYAKKMTPAPAVMPPQPNSPCFPVGSGMNGDQFAGSMYDAPKTITSRTTSSFATTIMLLTAADSRMPMTSRAVSTTQSSTAGRLTIAPVAISSPVPSTT